MTPTATQEAYLDSADYPAAWIFDEDGESLSGTFVGFAEGQTRNFGRKPIAVLEVDGEKRSVWLTQTVLYGKFRDELQARANHRIEPGERVNIQRHGKVKSEGAMGEYWSFSVGFPDRPELDVEALFDLGEPKQEKPTTEPEKVAEDDVPF